MRRRIAQLLAKLLDEFRSRLQVWRTIERSVERAAKRAACVDFRSARRTGVEMLEDLVVRLRQQLIAQERVGDFPNVTTSHDASSMSLFRVIAGRPADGRTTSAAASSVLGCARPRWSLDITVPMGIAKASAASL